MLRGRRFALLIATLLVATEVFVIGGGASIAATPLPGPVVRITPATGANQQETTIAINPTNPRNLVAGSIDGAGGGRCAVYYSTDRGASWTAGILPLDPAFTEAGDPVVDFAADGTAYFLCMNTANGNAQLGQYVYVSTNGGQNWSTPVLAIARAAGDADDKGHIVVDDSPASPYLGNVYVAATRLTDTPPGVQFARSTTQGAGFTNDQVINDTDIGFAVNLAVGADGAVYAAWSREAPANPGTSIAIMIDKSTDGGVSFGALSGGGDHTVQSGGVVTGGVRPEPGRGNGSPYIATHPTNPNIVYAVWAEDPAGIDDSDIRFSRSADGGNSWSASIRVNTDVNPAGEFFSQFWPTMSVDPITGDIDIIWYSDQNDPNRTDGTPLIDLYFTSSSNDGASFASPVRVTPASSRPFGFFGDYLGIDSYGGVAHPIWVDTTFTANNQDPATTQIGAADLRITKGDNIDPAIAGEQLTYNLTVTNDGPADAADVVVTDTLPGGVTFSGATAPCVQSPPGTLTCPLGLLESGATAAVGITVDVDPGLVHDAGGAVNLTNSASVASTQGDPDQSNNTAQETTAVVAETDLGIVSFTVDNPPSEVMVGDETSVTLRKNITNGGPSGPVDVAVTATVGGDAGITVTPPSVTTTAADVAVGEIRELTETFSFTCLTPGPHNLTFTNVIQPNDGATSDPNLADNTASVVVAIDCIVPIAINIKPGNSKNRINLKSRGVTPVGLLTTAPGEYGLPLAFDATSIDVSSLRFGTAALVGAGGGSPDAHGKGHPKDVKELDEKTKDGDTDLLLHFRTKESGLDPATTAACVRGTFVSGGNTYTFVGCDAVRIKS